MYDLVGLTIPTDDEIKLDSKKYEAAKKKGRDARFKVTVTSAYNHTCALYRINITTLDSEFIVEASHIHEHSKSRNNEPQNGIALCRNAHWLFDRGLWSVDQDFRVLVATHRFTEFGNPSLLLSSLAGQEILLPKNRNLWPSQTHLDWHRKNIFGKSRKC